MYFSKRKMQHIAAMAHQALALGSLLALMILIPTRDPQGGLGSQFREPNRVPVRVHALTPALVRAEQAKLERALHAPRPY